MENTQLEEENTHLKFCYDMLVQKKDVITDLKWLNTVADMVSADKDRYIRALEEELQCYRGVVSN